MAPACLPCCLLCWLDSVVSNLVSNAIKYGNGSAIDVSVEARGEDAVLIVRDRGIGIEPDAQTRIFDRFERLRSAKTQGGFGLGLWIVRQIIEAHGGTIAVNSSPGHGSEFVVTLPCDREPEAVVV